MTKQEFVKSQKRGRPATGKGVPVLVRLQPDDVALIDWHIEQLHQDDLARRTIGAKPMTRPQAIRKLLESALDTFRIKKAHSEGRR